MISMTGTTEIMSTGSNKIVNFQVEIQCYTKLVKSKTPIIEGKFMIANPLL